MLASEVVRLTPHRSISRATIGRRLAENDLKPWQEKMWCVPAIDATYVARMEDVLGLYTTLPRPGTAVVCIAAAAATYWRSPDRVTARPGPRRAPRL